MNDEFVIGGEGGVTLSLEKHPTHGEVCVIKAADFTSDTGRIGLVLALLADELSKRVVCRVDIDDEKARAVVTTDSIHLSTSEYRHFAQYKDVAAACLQIAQEYASAEALAEAMRERDSYYRGLLNEGKSMLAGSDGVRGKTGIEGVWKAFGEFTAQQRIEIDPLAKNELQGTLQLMDTGNPNQLINTLRKFFKDQKIELGYPQQLALQAFCLNPVQYHGR